MDASVRYKLMCLRAKELQDVWKPKVGDHISTKSCLCDEEDINCSEEQPCEDCLNYSNTFVISGEDEVAKELGGTHWYFGGGPCVRGSGHRMNSTYCFEMTRTGFEDTSSQEDMIWLPRQDQLQQMFWPGLTEHYKVRKFIEYLDTTAEFNLFYDSLESQWLSLYMKEKHNKKWNRKSDVQQWEEIQ